MAFKSGEKRAIRVTGSRKLNDMIREENGNKIITVRYWNEGVTTKGETIGFVAGESLNGRVANCTFQAKDDVYQDRDGKDQKIRADRWQFSTAGSAGDLNAVKADLDLLKELAL
jgi:hypothetical protein